MQWTLPGPRARPGNNLANALVLAYGTTNAGTWFSPTQYAAIAKGSLSPGFDILGRDLDLADAVSPPRLSASTFASRGCRRRASRRISCAPTCESSGRAGSSMAPRLLGSATPSAHPRANRRKPADVPLDLRHDDPQGEHVTMRTHRHGRGAVSPSIELTVSLVAGLIVAMGIVGALEGSVPHLPRRGARLRRGGHASHRRRSAARRSQARRLHEHRQHHGRPAYRPAADQREQRVANQHDDGGNSSIGRHSPAWPARPPRSRSRPNRARRFHPTPSRSGAT